MLRRSVEATQNWWTVLRCWCSDSRKTFTRREGAPGLYATSCRYLSSEFDRQAHAHLCADPPATMAGFHVGQDHYGHACCDHAANRLERMSAKHDAGPVGRWRPILHHRLLTLVRTQHQIRCFRDLLERQLWHAHQLATWAGPKPPPGANQDAGLKVEVSERFTTTPISSRSLAASELSISVRLASNNLRSMLANTPQNRATVGGRK